MIVKQSRKIITILLFFVLAISGVVVSAQPVVALSAVIGPKQAAQLTSIDINFNNYTPTSFSSQDVKPTMTIEDGGNTLHLKGNSWKKISLPYAVTTYTVLEFDFKSPVQAEVQGIGFSNQSLNPNMHQLYGTQVSGINVSYYKYASFAPEWRHYRIPVGQYYAGNMLYMIFVNDHDVSNPTGESYFSNIQVYEESSALIQPPVNIDFNQYSFSPYSGLSESPALTMTIEDGGSTLHMVGNGWQKILFPYAVTNSTVLEFDFKSGSQAEVQAIGFDADNVRDTGFELYGTQAWGRDAFQYSNHAPEWKHFRIPVGKYTTGTMQYLFFANDHDISNPTSESYFRNLSVYEGEVSLPVSVDFNQYALSMYYSPAGNTMPTVSVLENGGTLHLSGNGWTQISMPISLTQNTILSFDFQSTAQGEIHGIGFDTDQNVETGRTFKLYGTQNYGLLDFNDYAASAPNWKHYEIPVGQSYTGQMLYLFFANDQDVTNPTAESYFKNVQIYDLPPTATPTATSTETPTLTPTDTATLTPTPTPTNIYSYDRAIAVNYADNWAHYRNPTYPLSNEVGCGCNDCTNYISQVLHEGGYPLRTGNWDENSLEEWWYRVSDLFQPDHSKTWSATDWFHNYALSYDENLFVSVTDSGLEPNLEPGDFILMDLRDNNDPDQPPDGKPDHARVVVGHGDISQNVEDYVDLAENRYGICETIINPVPTPPETQTLLINQHCTDRWHVAWDYNLDPETRKFYIHVID